MACIKCYYGQKEKLKSRRLNATRTRLPLMDEESQINYCLSTDSSETTETVSMDLSTAPLVSKMEPDTTEPLSLDSGIQLIDTEEELLQPHAQETQEGTCSVQATMVTGSGSILPPKSLTSGNSSPQSSLVVSGKGGVTQRGLVTGSARRQTQSTFRHAIMVSEEGSNLPASTHIPVLVLEQTGALPLHCWCEEQSSCPIPQYLLSSPPLDNNMPCDVRYHVLNIRRNKNWKQIHEADLKRVQQCIVNEVVGEEIADALYPYKN